MSPQESIAHYRLTAKLGEGGMGAVYRATDTKLNRDVAIKILPDAFASDPDRLARFTREAQVLASLNHPNIAAIYGVEDRAIVMELVEGDDIKGPLAADEALPIIDQLIDALEYAHERGIVHRDLKPANLKLTPDRRLKVLDFGLAKALSTDSAVQPGSDPAVSPTLTMRATMAGVIMGTAAYMSPEQARGHLVDRRADIWSFGVVVYELLAGKALFDGGTVSDILAAVLTREIELSATPARFRRLLEKCLTRDPRRRLRDISGARLLLEAADPAPARLSRRAWFPWTVAAVSTAAAVWTTKSRTAAQPSAALRFSIPPPEGAKFQGYAPAISPDGRRIAFIAAGKGPPQLWLRNLDEADARPLAGTAGALTPFWSPAGDFIAFFADGKLKKLAIAGGPPITICDSSGNRGGAWGPDGTIVFTSGPVSPISRVNATGGDLRPATRFGEDTNENSHRWPSFLPDGKHFLFLRRNLERDKVGIYVGDLGSDRTVRVSSSYYNAVYSPPGWLLFIREKSLMAQPFDASSLRLSGEAIPLADDVDLAGTNSSALFSVSNTASIAYLSGTGGVDTLLTWYDLDGRKLGTMGPPSGRLTAAISPDGRFAVEDRQDVVTGSFHLWVHDLEHGTDSRLSTSDKWASYPIWSPDSRAIVYMTARAGGNELNLQQANGAGPEQLLFRMENLSNATHWSPDGRFIAFNTIQGERGIWILPMTDRTPGKPYPFLASGNESVGRFSPDGKWLAYQSTKTSRSEIYVTSFPEKRETYRISTNGGADAVWDSSGRHLFYRAPDSIMRVDVSTGARFSFNQPRALFHVTSPGFTNQTRFDVAPDGKRLLVRTPAESSTEGRLNVIVNWPSLVKK